MTENKNEDKGAEGSADAIQEGDFIDDRVKDEADEVDEASIEAASSDCNESNLTEYRLATPEIQNGGNTTLVYIVDVSKCQEEDDLRFGWDINAVYQPPPGGSQVFTPDYSIPELGLEGTLKSIKGGDLFGNFGDNYAYLEMPEALVIQKSIAKLNIHITLPDGYLYTDLSTIYERAGKLNGRKGSVTQVPILSMPSDDITHPIPDLTGYITEGQIVVGRDLFRQGVYPPINILMSLSRLMKDGIGEGSTREDHGEISNQVYDAYSRAQEVRALAGIVGKAGLTEIDLKYLDLGDTFEKEFLTQATDENRTIEETLTLMWKIVSKLPKNEITKIKDKYVEQYYKEE